MDRRTRLGVWSAALFTAGVGVVNLVSAVAPGLPDRVHWLRQLFPFEVRASGHLFSAISGFLLLTLAANLLRRKRVAWIAVVCLLVVSIISNLVKGLDYEEGILSAALLGQLLLMRKVYTAQSDRPSVIQGIRVLFGALLFTLAYGTLGFFFLDKHYSTTFSLPAALRQTLAMFFTADNAGLVATHRFGQFFADSIYVVGTTTLLYALWMLLRPVIFRVGASEEERQRAKVIVEQYGHSSLARFTLLEDKSYYFSPSGQTVIAYVPKGRGAIALGDPIGPESDRAEAILGFQQFCISNDWQPAFYQTLKDDLEIYQNLGFQTLKIGEEAVVDLTAFTLEGKVGKNLRTSMNKFKKLGYRIEFYPPPISNSLLQELRAISNQWLEHVEGAEKKFSLGWFDDGYLRDCEIAVVHNKDNHPVAFANIIPEYQNPEATIDLMRHQADVERGAMDYLFVSMFQHFKALGFKGFNLGLAALSGVGETSESTRMEKGMHYLYEHLNQFYNFQGLRAYKDKFHPEWEPRYMVYPTLASLPDVAVGLVRADSDDQLGDYFGTQFLSTALANGFNKVSKYIPVVVSLLLFGLSAWAIAQELEKYKPGQILSSLQVIPFQGLLFALALTALNYVFLTGYDTLATRYVQQPISYRKVALVSVISYAISNSIGLSLLSGSAIRYRFYKAWGFSAGKIAQIITFCNISFWIGLFAVGGISFSIEPLAVPKQLRLPFDSIHPVGYAFLMAIAAYIIWSAIGRRSLRIKQWFLPHLSLPLTLGQVAVTSCDWILAAAVLFVLLPSAHSLSFWGFFGIFLLAQLAGIISNVPGGLGVFETVIVLLLSPPITSDKLLGALLAYRAIYYFIPLFIGIVLFAWYELNQRSQTSRPLPEQV
ncbi:MAG: phosphatidylglycerol lysyltransferase domain-containing protein [Phormidesmis sp.]